MIKVIDLSQWEDSVNDPRRVDFQVMKQAGVAAAYFRCGNGLWKDTAFDQFRADANAAGMPWGAYGIMYPTANMTTQAKAFAVWLGLADPGKLPIVIDWELAGVTWQMVYEYMAVIQNYFPGKELIIYSREEYLRRMLPSLVTNAGSYQWFEKFAVWQAHYETNVPAELPVGMKRVLWQYTDREPAAQYGITESKMVDMSYFDGTQEQFEARFGLTTIAPPVPDPAPVVVKRLAVLVAPNGVFLRRAPSVISERLKALEAGTEIEFAGEKMDSSGNTWGQVSGVGWVCMVFQGVTLVRYVDDPAPAPIPDLNLPARYRIMDDVEVIKAGLPARPTGNGGGIRNGLPSTVVVNGGTGNVKLAKKWIDYLGTINDARAMNYLFKEASGWHNSGDKYTVRQITFSGNVVEVTRIETISVKGKIVRAAFVKSVWNSDNPPSVPVRPTPSMMHPLIQLFSTQYTTHCNFGDPVMGRILLIANPGEELWMNADELVRV